MKRVLFILLGTCFLYTNLFAQTITTKEKLYYTCKVWGLVKYYHSEVSTCQVNWDSVLVHYLPKIKNTATYTEFNEQLDSMILAAGPMAIATTAPPAALPIELSRNLNFSWTNDPAIQTSVRNKLDTIRINFRPHPNCVVQKNTGTSGGWLLFPQDSLMLNINTLTTFPTEEQRLLILFKYWNIVRYFNPYNYVLDKSWDSTLYHQTVDVVNATNSLELEQAIQKIATNLDDAHVEGLTYNINTVYNKFFKNLILLRYADSKYVVVKTSVNGVAIGDEIVSVNGLTVQQMEDSLRPYISAGNPSVFHRYMCQYLLAGSFNTSINIVLKNASGNNYTINDTRTWSGYAAFFNDYYPSDSLKNTKWKTLDCNVGYVHMGNLEQADVNSMYNDMKSKPTIIFDIRNYPQGTAFTLTMLMFAQPETFAHDIEPDVDYPGAFKWFYHTLGNASLSPYTGQVILLMDQETQSHAEYSCMILERLPNVIKVGSQTAGTDGNISSFRLTDNFYAGFTSLGIYYPNGDSTQRIGIVPDSVVHPTQAGLRAGRDEVLEKAMQIACALSVKNTDTKFANTFIYPNPVTDVLHVNTTIEEQMTISVTNLAGMTLMSEMKDGRSAIQMNIGSLPAGMYFLNIKTDEGQRTFKFTKQ